MTEITFRTPVHFPDVCASCHAPAPKQRRLAIKGGFEAIVHRHVQWSFISVPFCDRCWARRRLASVLVPAGVIVGIAAGASATGARAAGWISGPTQMQILFVVLAWILLVANVGYRTVNFWFLGVCGTAFSVAQSTVTLRFRDAAFVHRILADNIVVSRASSAQ